MILSVTPNACVIFLIIGFAFGLLIGDQLKKE